MNKRKLFARIIFDAILFLAVLFAPWWLFALFALAGIAYWERHYEALALALFFDLLYLPRYFLTLGILVLYILIAFIKTKIR